MSRQYSPKSFLRQAPNTLLKQYLTKRGIGEDIPWKHLSERKIEHIQRAIDSAPEKIRREIDTDFRRVYGMADEGGTKTLIDEGRDRHHRVELAEDFAKMGGHLERAFWTFLHHPKVFRVAQQLHYAAGLASWDRSRDLPECKPDTSREGTRRLESDLSQYYSRAEGRGHHCKVDHYRRDSRLYWFAHPEDYAESRLVYDIKHMLRPQTQRPAFEVIFVYDEKDRWLDLHARGSHDTKRELRLVFGRAILGVDLSGLDDQGISYELNGILRPDFQFVLQPEDGVDCALLQSLRVRIMGEANRRITLEANTRKDPGGVRELLQVVLKAKGIPSDLVVADRASIQLVFRPEAASRKRLTIRVSHPNSCSLKHDPEDDIARELLRRWNIDVSGRTQDGSAKRRRSVQYIIRD